MYSLDFRKRVLAIREKESLSIRAVSVLFGVHFTTVTQWLKRIEPTVKRNKPATRIDMEALRRDITTHPDAFMYERAERLGVSTSCIFFALKRLGVTYKKKSGASQGVSRRETLLPQDARKA